jgi:hypothetical protein
MFQEYSFRSSGVSTKEGEVSHTPEGTAQSTLGTTTHLSARELLLGEYEHFSEWQAERWRYIACGVNASCRIPIQEQDSILLLLHRAAPLANTDPLDPETVGQDLLYATYLNQRYTMPRPSPSNEGTERLSVRQLLPWIAEEVGIVERGSNQGRETALHALGALISEAASVEGRDQLVIIEGFSCKPESLLILVNYLNSCRA